jgi:hypothetical protein
MLDYNRSYLWPNLIKFYPIVSNIITEYSVNSWDQSVGNDSSNIWLTASYLFDHSENSDNLKLDFKSLLQKLQPTKILLSSSLNKKVFTNQLAEELKENEYVTVPVESSLIYSGVMTKTLEMRQWLNKNGCSLNGTPTWNEHAIYGLVLTSKSPYFGLNPKEEIDSLNLYVPPIKVRRDIVLNHHHHNAAAPAGKPTIIIGPAGCGKSVVITERIVKVIEESIRLGTDKKLGILLTTFNKELKFYLKTWLIDLLDQRKIEYTNHENGIKLKGSDFINVVLMHFDVLPYRVWKLKSPSDFPFQNDSIQFDYTHKKIAQQAISEIKSEEKITTIEYDNVLDPDYVLDEYYRVIYGQDYNKESVYLVSQRKGRPRLNYSGTRRSLLFKTIARYLKILEEKNYSSFITRRHKFLKKLKSGAFNNIFDYIFIDEFQDCTQSDYNIFYRLLKDPNNLILAGDYAQAVHLGTVADVPRFEDETSERMKNRTIHRLEGSYRLPYRISECLKPLSESIKINGHSEADILTPYKGAPPGARPIIVYANNNDAMSRKVLDISNSYSLFDIINIHENPMRNMTILEKDFDLQKQLISKFNNIAVTDTILRLKGMEKTFVLWSTKSSIDHQSEIDNFVYTILTRTSGILVIAISDDIIVEYQKIIKELRKDRIILWDQETKDHFNKNYAI